MWSQISNQIKAALPILQTKGCSGKDDCGRKTQIRNQKNRAS
jgi:hypothetical protein